MRMTVGESNDLDERKMDVHSKSSLLYGNELRGR